ncbi:MAG: hypothetical protein NT170_03635 [Candidatus Moranbacteria bacterium]|nr:hypothetical protein [Candidatus Moranbacteria bacterium]
MSYSKISEAKWALVAILQKISDIVLVNQKLKFKADNGKEYDAYFISNFFLLDSVFYSIQNSIFKDIIENLKLDKAIRIVEFQELEIFDSFNDEKQFLEYTVKASKENPKLSIEEIQNQSESLCWFIVDDFKKIKRKIKELKSDKVSPETLKNNFEKAVQQEKRDENVYEKKQIDPNFIVKKGKNYFLGENLIHFGENTQYKDLFDIIYSDCLQEDFVSYEDINKKLIEKNWKDIPKKKINKRIQNSITNGIFRFSKIDDKKIKNKLSNGKKILEIIRGKGIKFNNR